MEKARALQIIQALADGHNPYTGEVFEKESVFQNPETVRALFVAISCIRILSKSEREGKTGYRIHGKPWTLQETEQLLEEYKSGKDVGQIAKIHGRTSWAIRVRLLSQGKI